MLNRKNLIIVLVVLVVLAGVAALQKSSHQRSTSHASSNVLVEGELSRDMVDRIVVGHAGEDVVELVKGEPSWRVASAYQAAADHQKIDGLLRNLGDLRGEFRSRSEDVLADYGFTDETTVSLRGYQGDREVFAVDLGNKPGGGQGGFVKRPGSAEVYLSQTGLLASLGLWNGPARPPSRHFLDLQAHTADKAGVVAMVLVDGGSELRLDRAFTMITPAADDTVNTEPYPDPGSWEWTLTDGTMVKKTVADNILNSATNLRAQDVSDPGQGEAVYGLDDPSRTLTLIMQDGSQTVLAFGDERPTEDSTPGGVFARVGDAPMVWVVGTYNVGNLFKTREELLPE